MQQAWKAQAPCARMAVPSLNLVCIDFMPHSSTFVPSSRERRNTVVGCLADLLRARARFQPEHRRRPLRIYRLSRERPGLDSFPPKLYERQLTGVNPCVAGIYRLTDVTSSLSTLEVNRSHGV